MSRPSRACKACGDLGCQVCQGFASMRIIAGDRKRSLTRDTHGSGTPPEISQVVRPIVRRYNVGGGSPWLMCGCVGLRRYHITKEHDSFCGSFLCLAMPRCRRRRSRACSWWPPNSDRFPAMTPFMIGRVFIAQSAGGRPSEGLGTPLPTPRE